MRGEGVYLWDDKGNKYLDLLGGIAVNSLGYGHPALTEAIAQQAANLIHVSNFFATEPQVCLAEALQSLLDAEGYVGASARVFFTNSGTEANEAAVKMALLHKPGGKIVALRNGFHGRTLGSLAITYKPAIREPFDPLPGNVVFIDPDVSALEAAIDDSVAAIFVEPIQGEAGVRPLPDGFLNRAGNLADRFNALLVVDEVQTGMGRTGRWFAHSGEVKADVITLAKSLGGGMPIGAVIGIEKAARLFKPGSHGSTFGGNPLAASAALAVIGEVKELLEHVRNTGKWLRSELAQRGFVTRGAGLLVGVEIENAPSVQADLLGRGFIVNAPNANTLRLAPPLIITPDQLKPFVEELGKL